MAYLKLLSFIINDGKLAINLGLDEDEDECEFDDEIQKFLDEESKHLNGVNSDWNELGTN